MRFFVYCIVLSLFVNLAFADKVLANTTSVEISNNSEGAKTNVSVNTNTGENTICINGKCETTSNTSESKSTVCINGKCYTSDDGNLNIEENNSTLSATITPNPTITQKPKTDTETIKQEIKKELESKHFDIGQIIRGVIKSFLSWFF